MIRKDRKKYSVLIIPILFLIISFLSIGYSALNQDLIVSGNLTYRADANIRITGISLKSTTSGGIELYSPNYKVNTIITGVKLPNINSTVSYDVTVENFSSIPKAIEEIKQQATSNENIEFIVSNYTIKDCIKGETILTLTITFQYKDTITSIPNDPTCAHTTYFKFVDYLTVDQTKPTVPTANIRENNSSGTILKNEDTWTNKTLWFGDFSSTDLSGIKRYEYSEECSGETTGTLEESGITFDSTINTYYCIRSVDNAENTSDWSEKYYFKVDKTNPTAKLLTSASNNVSANPTYMLVGSTITQQSRTISNYNLTKEESDAESGIASSEITCTATKNGSNVEIKTEETDSKFVVYNEVDKNADYVIYVSCTLSVIDNAGNKATATRATNLGSGWYLYPGGFEYLAKGTNLTGWHYLWWYNGTNPQTTRWYYFYTGTETAAANSCTGTKYNYAQGWCKEIGGYSGWYYLKKDGDTLGALPSWYPLGSMFANLTTTINGSSYTFNASGRCISGSGCY